MTLEFEISGNNDEGTYTELFYDLGEELAPISFEGLVASADASVRKVWLTYTAVDVDESYAIELARDLRQRIVDAFVKGSASVGAATA